MHAMDIYRQQTCPPAPKAPPAPPTGGGSLIGYIFGTDTILLGHPQVNSGPLQGLDAKVCYGTVVRRGDTEEVVALRATDGFAEWVEDGEFLMMPYAPAHPVPAGAAGVSVEQGFWGIYHSLLLTDAAGTVKGPVARQLPAMVDPTDRVVVAGHSLGAALATYLTLDLARGTLGPRTSGCFFASPHPGNQAFASLFARSASDYVVYYYVLDVVPRMPLTDMGYCALPNVRAIQPQTAQAEIAVGLGCNHHIICYLAMLDCRRRCRQRRRCRRGKKPAPNASADRIPASRPWRTRW